MKYLKHINEYNSDAYYKEITDDEFYKKVEDSLSDNIDESTNFTKKEINTIRRILKNEDFEIEIEIGSISIDINGEEFTFYKIEDEWYYIRYYKIEQIGGGLESRKIVHYKCDQFEGLIEFLKFIIK